MRVNAIFPTVFWFRQIFFILSSSEFLAFIFFFLVYPSSFLYFLSLDVSYSSFLSPSLSDVYFLSLLFLTSSTTDPLVLVFFFFLFLSRTWFEDASLVCASLSLVHRHDYFQMSFNPSFFSWVTGVQCTWFSLVVSASFRAVDLLLGMILCLCWWDFHCFVLPLSSRLNAFYFLLRLLIIIEILLKSSFSLEWILLESLSPPLLWYRLLRMWSSFPDGINQGSKRDVSLLELDEK